MRKRVQKQDGSDHKTFFSLVWKHLRFSIWAMAFFWVSDLNVRCLKTFVRTLVAAVMSISHDRAWKDRVWTRWERDCYIVLLHEQRPQISLFPIGCDAGDTATIEKLGAKKKEGKKKRADLREKPTRRARFTTNRRLLRSQPKGQNHV